MTQEQKKLIDLLKFTINEKANVCTRAIQLATTEHKTDYLAGQRAAYSSIYTMLENMERTL